VGVDAGLYMYDDVVKSSRSLSHLLMSSCLELMITQKKNNTRRLRQKQKWMQHEDKQGV